MGPAPVLGSLAQEVDYFETLGSGTIEVLHDPSSPSCCFAELAHGRSVIVLNPALFGAFPPAMQSFLLAHETGHHYLQHTFTVPTIAREFAADAFGLRVLFGVSGAAEPREVLAWFRANPSAGNPTHASNAARADYLAEVLVAVEADPSQVPPVPAAAQRAAARVPLVLQNPLREPASVLVDLGFAGALRPGQSAAIHVLPGPHRIDLRGLHSGAFKAPRWLDVEAPPP